MVVHRHDMRATLERLCRVLNKAADAPVAEVVVEEVAAALSAE